MKNFLFRQTDNAPLVLFRIFFGFLLACETIGAIFTGWVKSNFIDPKFTFSHIGLEWLQPLPGYGMYAYFALMGILGFGVMLGYRYRASIIGFTLLWGGVYFMQKTSYNNHYYLLLLISLMMCFLPAHSYRSLDVSRNPKLLAYTMPAWCRWALVAQVSIVYFFATIAKFYPDWLNGNFTYTLLDGSITSNRLRTLLVTNAFAMFIAWAGIAFDLLVVPLMLWKRTRTIALIASLIFHIFNSITLKIGIFPFFALTFAVFMYPPETIRRIFFKKKPPVTTEGLQYDGLAAFKWFFIPYFIIQLALPLRHHFIDGDVLWTEEGHRLSWRMMLRSRSGYTSFRVTDKKTGALIPYFPAQELTQKQERIMATHPDMIWQMAQRIKQHYAAEGRDVSVHVNTRISVNGAPYNILIDPETDLASVPYYYFGHSPWILLHQDKP